MFKLIEQSVTEARQAFTTTLTAIARDDDNELVVLVRKRGEPMAGIISAREFSRYFQWKADQARTQPNDTDDNSQPEEASKGPESPAAGEGDSEGPQSTGADLSLPEGWSSPEEYVRLSLSEGHSPELVLQALEANYCKYGLTSHDAAHIVVGVASELGVS